MTEQPTNNDLHNEDFNQEKTNTKETPTVRGGFGMLNGIESNPGFRNGQPDPALKKKGWARRNALKALLKITNPGKIGTKDYAQLAADFYGMDKEEVTVVMIMHFRQMEKSILTADTPAYEAVLKRAYGNPNQPLTGANNSPLMPAEQRIVHVHSDVPLAENEDDVVM